MLGWLECSPFVKGGTFCIDSCSDKCIYLNHTNVVSSYWAPFETLKRAMVAKTSQWNVNFCLVLRNAHVTGMRTWNDVTLYELAWHGRSVRWPWMWVSGKIRGIIFDSHWKTRSLKTCPKISGLQNFTRGNETHPNITISIRSIINHEPLKNHGSPIMILWDFWYFCNCKPRTSLLFYPFSALGHRRCSALCKRSNLGWSAPSRIKTFFSLCSRFLYKCNMSLEILQGLSEALIAVCLADQHLDVWSPPGYSTPL